MKRIFTLIAVVMLVLGMAGAASAYDIGNLILTAYGNTNADGQTGEIIPSGSTEVGVDLGAASDWANLTNFNTGITLDDFSTTIDGGWSDVIISLYAGYTLSGDVTDEQNGYYNSYAYVSGSSMDVAYNTFKTGYGNIQNIGYDDINGKTVLSTSDTGSYVNQLGGGAVDATGTSYEYNLAGISTTNFVTIDLYYAMTEGDYVELLPGFGGTWNGVDPTDADLVKVGTLTLGLNEAGQLIINPIATPVPAAVWLLGSGILALVGIRRKK